MTGKKGLTLKAGQTHIQHYMPAPLNAVLERMIGTTFPISHRMDLEDTPEGHDLFKSNRNDVTKVVPGSVLTEQRRKMVEPGSAEQ